MNEIERLKAENDALRKQVRESALQELASLGQAQEAWEAQKAAEAVAEKLRRALRDIEADCDADYPPSHGAIKQAARAALSATTEAAHDQD